MISLLFVTKCLQMPTREACHVALQKIHPAKQRLWKHTQARHNAKGQGQIPVLQIVYEFFELKFYMGDIQNQYSCLLHSPKFYSVRYHMDLN